MPIIRSMKGTTMKTPISVKEYRRRHTETASSFRPVETPKHNVPAARHSSIRLGDKLRDVPERSLRRMASGSDMIVRAEAYKPQASYSKAEQIARIASHEKALFASAERKLANGDHTGAAKLLGKIEANRKLARSLIDGLQAGTEFVSIQVSGHMGYSLMPSDKPVKPCAPLGRGWNNKGRAKRYDAKP